MIRIRFFVLAALMVALASVFTACGSGGGSSEDPQKVIDEATLKGVESGDLEVNLKVNSSENGAKVNLSLSGPFESEGEENLPQLDMTVKADGSSEGTPFNFSGGLTLLSDRAFIEYEGDEYEVDPTTFGFVKSGFEQAQQEGGQESAGSPTACQKAAEGLEVDKLVDNVTSEGGVDVDGTSTTKVSGDLNVGSAIDAVIKLTKNPACGSQIEAAGQLPLSELESQRGELEDAIKKAHADVYVGDDHIIRKVVAEFTVEEGGQNVEVELEVALGNVNEEQDIKAPSGAKPLEELFQKLGVNPLELLEGASGGGGASGLGTLLEGLGGASSGSSGSSGSTEAFESPEYLECLQEVETPADLQKCANLVK